MDLYNTLIFKNKIALSKGKMQKLKTIEKIYAQQHQRAYGKADEKIKDRIVSLYKPYVRPIVRGKEVKPVEFGAKVNKLEVDGIGFIEHLSFDNFNETTRFSSGIYLQRKLFGKCTHQSAGAIYATNKNRKYAPSQRIQTNFYSQRKRESSIHRAIQTGENYSKYTPQHCLGRKFWQRKNHYLLQKSRARIQSTDICWIFFGIMTANASIIAKRMVKHQQLASVA